MKAKQFLFLIFISFQVYSQKLDILIHKADSALNKGNVTIALQLYSKAIKIDTNNAYLYIRKGMYFKFLNENKSALTDLTKGLNKCELQENRIIALRERGKVYRNSDLFYNAFEDYMQLALLSPNDKLNYELMDEIIDKSINYDSCRLYITNILNKNDDLKNKSFFYFYRSIFNARLEYSSAVISDLQNLKLEYNKFSKNDTTLEYSYGYNYRLAYRYYIIDSLELAYKYVNNSLKLIPTNQDIIILKLDVLVAKKDFLQLEEYLNYIKSTFDVSDIDYYWGQLYIHKKKYKEAVKAFKTNVSKVGEYAYIYNRIGYCYSQLKQFPEALKYYTTSLKLDSLNPTYNSIAWNYFLQKKYKEGIPYTNKCLRIDSTNANYFDTKACLLFGLDNFKESIIYFNKAILLKPSLTNSYVYRARANIRLNNKGDACSDIEMIKIITLNINFDTKDEDLKLFSEKHCK
ncbi:MAG: tetratricopeptide repeat protein [Bacteroidetes bacterium]|nr:tetratricopeptide repeat protein [Bacteroidota bacterium]